MPTLHILGICGTFMSSVALIAQQLGWVVTGSDAHCYPPIAPHLAACGIQVIEDWDPALVDALPSDTLYIIGNAITRGNPILERLLNEQRSYLSGPAWIAHHVLQKKTVLAVAGTHGKTTTTSMLAWILQQTQPVPPGFLIGGIPHNFHTNARYTDSPYFVIEADEYDTCFDDKRSKFIHYKPTILLLNNLEFDHGDIFENLASIQNSFHHLIRTVKSVGHIIVNGCDRHLQQVLSKGVWSEVTKFGPSTDWAFSLHSSSITIQHHNTKQGEIHWSLCGQHNGMNALAAIVAASKIGITPEQACQALCSFAGVKRRLDHRGSQAGITVYDDFAHHPTAIRETISALHSRHPDDPIVIILHPTSNTMRSGIWGNTLGESCLGARYSIIYTDAQQELEHCFHNLPNHDFAPNPEKLKALLLPLLPLKPVIAVLSNRDAEGIHQCVQETLTEFVEAQASLTKEA